MSALDTWAWLDARGYAAFGYLLSVLWQSSLLFVFAGGVAWALRKRRPRLRHALWLCAVLLAPLLPLLSVRSGAPQAPVEVLPSYATLTASPQGQPEPAQPHPRAAPMRKLSPPAPVEAAPADAVPVAAFLFALGLRHCKGA